MGVDYRRQRVSLDEQTAILGPGRLQQHVPQDFPARTEQFPNGRDYVLVDTSPVFDLVRQLSMLAWSSDERRHDPDHETEVSDDDLVDALRLLQAVRIELNDTELRLLESLATRGVPDERVARARACDAEEMVTERDRLRAEHAVRYWIPPHPPHPPRTPG